MSDSTIDISGMGVVSSLGCGVTATYDALKAGKTNARYLEDWAKVDGLQSHVACMVDSFDAKNFIPRTKRRTMSKMSEMLCWSAMEALENAGLRPEDLNKKRTLIIVGSTTGSPTAFEESLKGFHQTGSIREQTATTVFKCMSSTAVVNLGLFLDFKGALLSPSAACSSATQAMILGTQFLKAGLYDIVIAGGVDECHVTSCISFDLAYAASRGFNKEPHRASRPFDKKRDGIVVSEGAGIVVLESESSLTQRSAKSQGKIFGGAFYADCNHMVHPDTEAISETMRRALVDSKLQASEIQYINAHATSTVIGDRVEADGIYKIFGKAPVSSFKGHLGHSFAACGATELIMTLQMMKENLIIGTHNLEELDPELSPLDYVTGNRNLKYNIALSNNFAFGGMNASIAFGI